MLSVLLSTLIIILPVLINVAFITLLERKILRYRQLRKGPNKVGGGGVLQPFNDAIKLFTKEIRSPVSGNKTIFFIGPVTAIFLSLSVWFIYPNFGRLSQRFSIIIVYTILSINVYPLIISGWASNSNYATIGSLRGIAQTISYEIRFALIILSIFLFRIRFRVYSSINNTLFFNKAIIFIPLVFIWLISCVAETNRTPFDFAEGESELVSGFNVEYGSGGFALIFMAEYARIYFLSFLFPLLFVSSRINSFSISLTRCVVVFFWVWLRRTLPRYRYDILIRLAWFSILPMRLFATIIRVKVSLF